MATTSSGDGAAPLPDTTNTNSEEQAEGAPPAPTAADSPAEPSPAASTESATGPAPGRVVIPSREEYEMPDEYASGSPVEKVKQWAQAHPGLALLAAGVSGLVIGRILVGIASEPEPETFADRVEARARQLSKEARGSFEEAKDSAGEAATASAAALTAAAVALKDAADRAKHKAEDWAEDAPDKAREIAEDGTEKAKDFAEAVGDAVKVAVTGVIAKKAADWVGKIRN
ncbi:MAG: hypothetical protein AAGI52_00695 [Bacteroidota bacterium]